MAVDFAYLLETDPLCERAPQKGQLFGLVLRLFRFRIRERFFVKRIVDVQRLVSLAGGNIAEYLVQVFRRYLPGVFGCTCRSKYRLFFNTFFGFRRYGRLWQRAASVEDKTALADDLTAARRSARNGRAAVAASALPKEIPDRPECVADGADRQQP